MTGEQIKAECEKLYSTIKESEARLRIIRGYCLHEKTQVGLYMGNLGSTYTAEICKDCGSAVRNLTYKSQLK